MVRQYQANQVLLMVAGTPITGFIDGDFLEVEFTENDWEVVQGTHGEVIRFRKVNEVGSVKISCMQGTKANALLSAVANLDRKTGLGAGLFSMIDTNGGDKITGARSWLNKLPTMKKGVQPGQVDWEATVGNMEMEFGELGLA